MLPHKLTTFQMKSMERAWPCLTGADVPFQVLLDKASIDRQKTQLQKENKELSEALQQFVDGISVPAGAIDDPQNTLLMVKKIHAPLLQVRGSKGRASLIKGIPKQVLTAAHAIAA